MNTPDHKFVRDDVSGAAINTDVEAYRQYRVKKRVTEIQQHRIDAMEHELCEVRSMVGECVQMMREFCKDKG